MPIGVSNLAVALTHPLPRFSLELILGITLGYIVDELGDSMIGYGIRMSLQVLLTLDFNLIALLHLIGCWLISDLQFAVQDDEAFRKFFKKIPSPHTSIGAIRHLDRSLPDIDSWVVFLIWENVTAKSKLYFLVKKQRPIAS